MRIKVLLVDRIERLLVIEIVDQEITLSREFKEQIMYPIFKVWHLSFFHCFI